VKIVITGSCSISCLGTTTEQIIESLGAAPKIGTVSDFGFHSFSQPQPCFNIPNFDPEPILGKKGLRTKDRATKLLLAACELGFKEMFATGPEELRPGLCIGTAFGSVQSIGDFLSDAIANGPHNVNPMAFANTVINAPTSNANIRYLSRMSSTTVSTTFNAGMDAFAYACTYIRSGHAKRLIVGGLEELSYYALAGLAKSNALSTKGTCMPFGSEADGFLMGEGCAVFCVETEESAKERNATIIAEIAGIHSCFDPKQEKYGYNPDASGAEHAASKAVLQAEILPNDISFIAASANGNPHGDAMEASVISKLFPKVPVAAYKLKTGECLGASGSLNVACALTDMHAKRISGAAGRYGINAPIDLVFDTREQVASNYVLVNSFSCDGYCASIVLKNRL